MKRNKGLSVYICIGKWDKISLTFNHKLKEIRLCLGFIAFAILFYDLEAEQKRFYKWALETDDKLKSLREAQ